jgi:hypothetical protein
MITSEQKKQCILRIWGEPFFIESRSGVRQNYDAIKKKSKTVHDNNTVFVSVVFLL